MKLLWEISIRTPHDDRSRQQSLKPFNIILLSVSHIGCEPARVIRTLLALDAYSIQIIRDHFQTHFRGINVTRDVW